LYKIPKFAITHLYENPKSDIKPTII